MSPCHLLPPPPVTYHQYPSVAPSISFFNIYTYLTVQLVKQLPPCWKHYSFKPDRICLTSVESATEPMICLQTLQHWKLLLSIDNVNICFCVFQPPRPISTRFNGLHATRFSAVCPQQYEYSSFHKNEDCLYLNVYSPVRVRVFFSLAFLNILQSG